QQQQLKQALLAAELSLEQLEQQLLLQHCQAPLPRYTPLLETYLALLTRDISAFNGQIIDLRQAIASLK
ncbi:MAG TPA: TIGR02444 family protein, partial [Rheinheimera sp.]|nr:TIGR02444 family protein [Rheinheimera sp.]